MFLSYQISHLKKRLKDLPRSQESKVHLVKNLQLDKVEECDVSFSTSLAHMVVHCPGDRNVLSGSSFNADDYLPEMKRILTY